MSATLSPTSAALWRENACFTVRYIQVREQRFRLAALLGFLPSAMHNDHELFLSDTIGEYSVRGTNKRTLFHSVDELWNPMLTMMKQL
jgi:hypothetical protein